MGNETRKESLGENRRKRPRKEGRSESMRIQEVEHTDKSMKTRKVGRKTKGQEAKKQGSTWGQG